MQTYDILMLTVLVGTIAWGAHRGFAWQIASLASIVASYGVAVRFRGPVAEVIGGQPPWSSFLAMLLLYIGTSVVIWMAFRVVSKTIDDLKLKGFDRQIGAIFGAVKGVILCVIITLFAVALLDGSRRQSIIDSRSGHYMARLLHKAHPLIPPEIHDVLEPHLHRFDERLDGLSQALDCGAGELETSQHSDHDPWAETGSELQPTSIPGP